MKLFISKLMVFLLITIIISTILDFTISHFLPHSKETQGEFQVWSHIYDKEAKPQLAIYGSSRAWVHIDPKILSDSLGLTTYNYGMDGHNFWLQYLRHLELAKKKEKSKAIILSVDIFSLQKTENLYLSEQFLPYMLWNMNIYNYTKSYNGYSTVDYFLPFVRYYGKTEILKTVLKIILNKSPKSNLRINGYLGVEQEWNHDFDEARENLKSYRIKIDQKSTELFEHFIIECKANDVDLVFVYTPEYIEGQKFILNRNDIIDKYKYFSSKYDIPFYDYSNDPISYNREYFYNASHLNKKGSQLFSKKFAKKLKDDQVFQQLQ